MGDVMKVKCFDEQHEDDLTLAINQFLDESMEVIDIKFSTAAFTNDNEQIFCFSALLLYQE